jgi:hypothetical protein
MYEASGWEPCETNDTRSAGKWWLGYITAPAILKRVALVSIKLDVKVLLTDPGSVHSILFGLMNL